MSENDETANLSKINLEPEQDFYFNEDGLMVFTEAYHLKRGTCCKSNCRHCPYEFSEKLES